MEKEEIKDRLVISMAVYNQVQMTVQTVELIRRHTQGHYELVLWDNGSRPEVQTYFHDLCSKDIRIKYLRSETNLGFIEPHNQIFDQNKDRCEYFCVLNNDVVIHERGWNLKMIEALKTNDKLAQVGNIQRFGVFNDQLMGVPGKHGPGFKPDYIEGSCFIVKTKIIRDNFPSLFDNKYLKFAYWEDSDLSLRLKSLGLEIAEVNVGVKHIGMQTLRNEKLPVDSPKYIRENHRVFRDRWEIFVKQNRKMRILVTRKSAQGDVLLMEPVLRELSYKYPSSMIYLNTKCPWMIENSGLPIIPITDSFAGIFDKTIDLDLAYENRPLMHIVDACAEQAGVVLTNRIPVYDPTIRWVPSDSKTILVNSDSCANKLWKSRIWDHNKWREVFLRLRANNYEIIEIGISKYLGVGRYALNMPLRELAKLMSASAVYLGPDNMLMHLAQGVGLPVIAFFGCICPNYRITDWTKAKAIWLDQDVLECAGCHHLRSAPRTHTECDKDRIHCIERITVDMVLDVFYNKKFGKVTKPAKQVQYEVVEETSQVEGMVLSQAETDLKILVEAMMIRQNPKRFMKAREIAGRKFIG